MARVMLVDDDPTSLEMRRMILGRAGHTVFLAPSADKGRQLARMMEMEVAVLDVRIPKPEDGLALIRDLRAAHPRLRLIALLAIPMDLEAKPESKMLQDILEKPIRSERLIESIANAMKIHL
ncbi:MAG: response regulator [Bryobacteraceae bacterium]